MRPLISFLLSLLLFGLTFCTSAQAAPNRTALVIGNSAYRHTEPLKNPKHDATRMAALLRQMGFNVFEGIDLTKAGMDDLIKRFAVSLETSESGVFYYAGHGLQIGGRNFLLPIDAELKSPASLEFEMVRLDQIQAIMERLTTSNILIMDACRNNPLSRNLARAMGTRSISIGSGLAASESGAGTLIAYATQPGSVALDGTGDHSPFTGALLKFLPMKGEDLSSILIRVRNAVMEATYGKQIPWEHSALSRRFYFIPPAQAAETRSTQNRPSPAESGPQLELAYWDAVKDSGNADMLRSYLERFPNGTFSALAAFKISELEKKTAALHKTDEIQSVRGETDKPETVEAESSDGLKEKIQTALKQAGCYEGRVDGIWGPATQSALQRFAESHGKDLASLTPTEANLQAVLSVEGLACPHIGETPESVESQIKPNVAEIPSARPAEPKPPKKTYTFCMDSRNLIVDCDDGSAVLKR